MRKLFLIRNARIYLLGDVVSTLGDSALWFAMAIWMKELTGSSAWAGLVFFCSIAGNLFAPAGGALADRLPRRGLLKQTLNEGLRSFLGVLITVQGVGAVFGGLAAAPLLKRVSEPVLIAMALACVTLSMLCLMVPDLVLVLTGMVVAGFVSPWLNVAGVTAFQRRTPDAMMGRVFGVFGLALTIPQVASIGLGAALITVVSYRVLLLVIAVVAAGAGVFLVSQPGTRRPGRRR
ncbi:MAG: MFS transporter [Trebonia sp.]